MSQYFGKIHIFVWRALKQLYLHDSHEKDGTPERFIYQMKGRSLEKCLELEWATKTTTGKYKITDLGKEAYEDKIKRERQVESGKLL